MPSTAHEPSPAVSGSYIEKMIKNVTQHLPKGSTIPGPFVQVKVRVLSVDGGRLQLTCRSGGMISLAQGKLEILGQKHPKTKTLQRKR